MPPPFIVTYEPEVKRIIVGERSPAMGIPEGPKRTPQEGESWILAGARALTI